MASKANAATYATGSATGIILAERFDKFAYVEAGRVFERAWLISTLHGLAFQPVTGVLFLGRRLVAKQTEVFNAKHLPMMQKAYATITTIFDTKEKIPAMLFRIGYADSPSARTIRKPPEIR